MKLLLDQNLSPHLIKRLSDLFPDSVHVQTISLDHASDEAVWNVAKDNGFIIVTKDADFSERSLILGSPPKIIWIRRGNCSTNEIEAILRQNFAEIEALNKSETIAVLAIF